MKADPTLDPTPDDWGESGASEPPITEGSAKSADTGSRRPLGFVWTEVIVDVNRLFRTEIALGQREIRDNLGAFGRAAALGGVALLLCGLAVVFLLAAGIVALAMAIGLLWALLAAGVACVLIALLLAVIARATIRGRGLLPTHAIARIRRDIAQLRNRTDDSRKAEEV